MSEDDADYDLPEAFRNGLDCFHMDIVEGIEDQLGCPGTPARGGTSALTMGKLRLGGQ